LADDKDSRFFTPDLSLVGAEHSRKYRETGGEIGYLWNGAPCLVLTTKGRKSGTPHDKALICGADGDNFVIVGSMGGAPNHPQWYLNLVADPHVEVQVRADRFPAVARTAEGAERERLWKLMTDIWPNYDQYQARTSRAIPVVVLEPVKG
jgi:deazaflavin-dependent oxidoreductase (nitroreductase family)